MDWITVVNDTVVWSTNDATLADGQYTVTLIASFSSSPVTTVTTTFSIDLQMCPPTYEFVQQSN